MRLLSGKIYQMFNGFDVLNFAYLYARLNFNLADSDATFIRMQVNVSVEEFHKMANKLFSEVSFWVDNKVHDNVSVQTKMELHQLFDEFRKDGIEQSR
jgi:hypothetical protein